MKRIFTILMAVLVASTLTIYDAEAQSLLFGRDSVRASKHPRSPFRINRIDRGIDTNAFAYKGEWICGVSASYGTLSTDDSDIALVIENLELGGSIVTVKPYFGYFYRNTFCYAQIQGNGR